MDNFTLISNLVASLAWPSAACVIVYMLKENLRTILSNIKRLKYGDTEIDFENGVADAISTVSDLPPQVIPSETPYELAEISPKAAVIESWIKIENALNLFCSRKGIESNPSKPFGLRNKDWQKAEYSVLGNETLSIMRKLRTLRNKAVRLSDSNINSESAREYQSLSNWVIQAIEKA